MVKRKNKIRSYPDKGETKDDDGLEKDKAGLTTGQEGKDKGGHDLEEGGDKPLKPLPIGEKEELERRFFIRLTADMERWYVKDTHNDKFVSRFGTYKDTMTPNCHFNDKEKLYHTIKEL